LYELLTEGELSSLLSGADFMMRTLTAQYIAPGKLPALSDGAIAYAGNIGASSGSDSSGSGRCDSGRSDYDHEKINDMIPAEVEIKRKRQALLSDDDVSSAAAEEQQRLPATWLLDHNHCQPSRCGPDEGSEHGGVGSDENDAAVLAPSNTHLDAAAAGPKPTATIRISKGGRQMKRAQSLSISDRSPCRRSLVVACRQRATSSGDVQSQRLQALGTDDAESGVSHDRTTLA
jgi:hypothetical protein